MADLWHCAWDTLRGRHADAQRTEGRLLPGAGRHCRCESRRGGRVRAVPTRVPRLVVRAVAVGQTSCCVRVRVNCRLDVNGQALKPAQPSCVALLCSDGFSGKDATSDMTHDPGGVKLLNLQSDAYWAMPISLMGYCQSHTVKRRQNLVSRRAVRKYQQMGSISAHPGNAARLARSGGWLPCLSPRASCLSSLTRRRPPDARLAPSRPSARTPCACSWQPERDGTAYSSARC